MNKPNYEESKDRTKVEIEYKENKEVYEKIVDGKKYFIRTYGCQMNVHDSEQVSNYLSVLGYESTDILEDADVVVLNTCAIRENAKDKLFGFLSRAKHLKETKKNDLIIVLCGCLMQVGNEIDFLEEKHKYVDIVIGTHNIEELPKFIINKTNTQNINIKSNSKEIYDNIIYKRDSDISAWVNITFGCDNFCTYCIVPFVRGRERSRKGADIIREINDLIDKGYKEVTLLGQNVNSYGNDFDYDYRFKDLLRDVASTNIKRIRFVTSNPWNFSDDVIDMVAKHDNVMPYIHLPVQSGSDKILKKMNRRYTKDEYINLFNKIKEKVPRVSITTDIIVGFPDESDEDFLETIDLVNKCKFDGAFTFIYSKREGTIAAKFEDNIDKKTKDERLYKLNDLINSYSNYNNQKYVGEVVPVLVMGISEKDNTKAYGYSDTMKLVNVTGGIPFVGEVVDVKISDAKSFSIDGEVLGK